MILATARDTFVVPHHGHGHDMMAPIGLAFALDGLGWFWMTLLGLRWLRLASLSPVLSPDCFVLGQVDFNPLGFLLPTYQLESE